jgi:hypothetical protein
MIAVDEEVFRSPFFTNQFDFLPADKYLQKTLDLFEMAAGGSLSTLFLPGIR